MAVASIQVYRMRHLKRLVGLGQSDMYRNWFQTEVSIYVLMTYSIARTSALGVQLQLNYEQSRARPEIWMSQERSGLPPHVQKNLIQLTDTLDNPFASAFPAPFPAAFRFSPKSTERKPSSADKGHNPRTVEDSPSRGRQSSNERVRKSPQGRSLLFSLYIHPVHEENDARLLPATSDPTQAPSRTAESSNISLLGAPNGLRVGHQPPWFEFQSLFLWEFPSPNVTALTLHV